MPPKRPRKAAAETSGSSVVPVQCVQCDFCEGNYNVEDTEQLDMAKWYCKECIDMVPALKGRLRTPPKDGWGTDVILEEIDESVMDHKISTKRHRIEGYNLFREGNVESLSSAKTNNIYFKGQCKAAMKSKAYVVYLCFKDETPTKLKWATCQCPAGYDGQCKHVVAFIYFIIDLVRQGLKSIPDVKTCTDTLQMWHVRKPLTDEPLLFSDIQFVKHDPFKVIKKELGVNVKYHNPVPHFASVVSQPKIETLVRMYDTNGLSLPVIDTIRSNNCCPVIPKQSADLQDLLFKAVQIADINRACVNEMLADLPPDHYDLYLNFFDGVDMQESVKIEKHTRMQSKNAEWFRQREYRLTGSTFGQFCRMKSTTDAFKAFERKKSFFTCKSVRHGIEYENVAFAKYCSDRNVLDSVIGLVVHPLLPFLGVSPDRLVLGHDDHILKLVEIKCPYSLFDKKVSIKTQIANQPFYLYKAEDGQIKLKENHDYFYQVQGQLNLTGLGTCDFVVFVPPNDIVTIQVKKDPDFFHNIMLPKLSHMWFKKLLPKFVEANK